MRIRLSHLCLPVCTGAENALVQHFRGYLADVSILPDKSESSRVIQCLNNCGEKLDFHAMSEMDAGMVSDLVNHHLDFLLFNLELTLG